MIRFWPNASTRRGPARSRSRRGDGTAYTVVCADRNTTRRGRNRRPRSARLLLGAVVERRIGQDDVAHAERPEPRHIPCAVELRVEDAVAREVVLPEPAARDRDPGGREIGGRPVADRVDRLDAVGRREMARGGTDRRRPVGRVGGRVRARLDEAAGERGQVPGDREREREERRAAAGASGAARASGSRSGSRRSAAARCSRRGPTERGTRPCRRRDRRRTSTAARRPLRTRHVSRIPRPQNTQAAANSGSENGNRPPAGNRRSNTSSTAVASASVAAAARARPGVARARARSPPGSPRAGRTRRGSPPARAPSAARSGPAGPPAAPRARAAPAPCRARTGTRRRARRPPRRPRTSGSTSATPAPTHATRRPRTRAPPSRCWQPRAA